MEVGSSYERICDNHLGQKSCLRTTPSVKQTLLDDLLPVLIGLQVILATTNNCDDLFALGVKNVVVVAVIMAIVMVMVMASDRRLVSCCLSQARQHIPPAYNTQNRGNITYHKTTQT